MITGIGTDIIEIDRVKQKVSKNSGFREKVFTGNEIEYCEVQHNRAECYAVRFAAKEAFLKAIGTGWRKGIKFNEIEILNDELGKPDIILYGKAKELAENKGVNSIHVSLSHLKNIVNAMVILETDKEHNPYKVFVTYYEI